MDSATVPLLISVQSERLGLSFLGFIKDIGNKHINYTWLSPYHSYINV